MAEQKTTNTAQNRTPRDAEARKHSARPQKWTPTSSLPMPEPEDGYAFRWVRVYMNGELDRKNVMARFREGYEPVLADDYPEIATVATKFLSEQDNPFSDNIEVGGLLLCKIPTDIVRQRNEYYKNMTDSQIRSVETELMQHNDHDSMRISKPQMRTTVSFGSPS